MQINDYVKNLATYYSSQNSVYQIKQKLEDFDAFNNHKNSGEITINHINNYLVFIDDRFNTKIQSSDRYENIGTPDRPRKTVSQRTKQLFLSAIRQFLMQAKEFNTANEVLVLRRRFKKAPQRLPVKLNVDETKKLVESAIKLGQNRKEGLTNKYIVLFLLDTGMRRAELCSINPNDIRFSEIKNSEGIYKHTIIGKGNKERVIYFHNALLLNYFRELHPINSMKSCLFERYNHKSKQEEIIPFPPQYVWMLVKDASRLAKITRNGIAVSPHKLRSTYITEFVRKLGIEKAQRAAGHSSIATTKIYTVDEEPDEKKIPDLTKKLIEVK